MREAVVAHLAPATLAEHHRRLVQVLEVQAQVDPEVLAFHCHGAGEHERAGCLRDAAARRPKALAFVRAARTVRLALELRPGAPKSSACGPPGADALAYAGHGPESARDTSRPLSTPPAPEALELRRRAATQFLVTGHLDEGLAELAGVLKPVGLSLAATPSRAVASLIFNRIRLRLRGLGYRPRELRDVPPEELARLEVSWFAAGGLCIIDPIRAAAFQARNLLLALDAGEPYRIGRALTLEASFVSLAGWSARRRVNELVRLIDRIAHQLDTPYIWAGVSMAHGVAAYMYGEWALAGKLLDQTVELFRTECAGVTLTFEIDTAVLFSLWSLQFRGEIAELSRRWPVVLKEALERGDRHVVTNLNTMLMSTLRLAANDLDGAEGHVAKRARRMDPAGISDAAQRVVRGADSEQAVPR